MPLYTVLAPPPPDTAVDPDPVAYVFVKDGFCWPCLFVPLPWIIFRRLWLVLLLYLLAGAIVLGVGSAIGGALPGLFLVLAHFYFALEANGLRRWTLERRGYRLIGVAQGRRVGEAEIRFFHELAAPVRRDPRQPPGARPAPPFNPPPPSTEAGEIVGFFPVPGGTR
jgi:hypothetical protein